MRAGRAGNRSDVASVDSSPPADLRGFFFAAGASCVGGGKHRRRGVGTVPGGSAGSTERGGEASTPCAQGWRVPRLRQAVLKAHPV